MNVVIIIKEKEISSEIDLDAECATIKELVKKASGSKNSTVTIVTTYKNHDRCLITNYYRIKHGSSFHLRENNLKGDVMTEIKTNAHRANEEMTHYLLQVFQGITSAPVRCIGDKRCNFLNFS